MFQEICGVTGLLNKLMHCGLNIYVVLLILTQACRQRRWEYIRNIFLKLSLAVHVKGGVILRV